MIKVVTDVDSQINNLSSTFASSTCISTLTSYYPSADPTPYLAQISSSTNSIDNSISSIPSTLHKGIDYLETYGNDKNLVVYILYAFVMFVAILFGLSAAIHSPLLSKLSISIGCLVVIALTIICCIEMVIVVSYAPPA